MATVRLEDIVYYHFNIRKLNPNYTHKRAQISIICTYIVNTLGLVSLGVNIVENLR